MLASILASVLIGLLILSAFRMRRSERRADSIARFADARKAMGGIYGRSAVRTPIVTAHPSEPEAEVPGVVVRSGSATLFDPIARRHVDQVRKSFRGDPEMLARRPTVAMLPTLLIASGEADANRLAPGCETDASPSAVSLPLPKSEAS